MQMKSPQRAPRLGSEFDAFLFSLIGEDRNGLPLSVVSLLARRDLDPWQEAASLAKLPADAAIQKLVALIWAHPAPPVPSPDRGATATRLIALLPRWPDSNIRTPEKPAEATAADTEAVAVALRRRAVIAAIVFASYIIVLIGAQLATSRDAPSTQANTADAPASSPTTPPQTLPPPSGK